MATAANITRRAAFASIGALVSTTALAIPAAAAIAPIEDAGAKVRRLQRELSAALAEVTATYGFDYVAVVKAEGLPSPRIMVDRDIYDATEARQQLRNRVIGLWRHADDAQLSEQRSGSFSRTRWENLNYVAQDALSDMLRVFRAT